MTLKDFNGDNAAMHDAFEDVATNTSNNKPFENVLSDAVSRRAVLSGGVAAAVAGFLAPQDAFAGRRNRDLVNFTPVSLTDYTVKSVNATVPVISPEYQYQALIPWGTPIKPGVTAYEGDPSRRPTAAEQENMIGIGHDGMWFFPENRYSNKAGMLCINHEFGTNPHLLGKDYPESLEDVRLSQAGHGCSSVCVKETDGKWDIDIHDWRNRRITVNTPVEFDGPVAGTEFLQNSANNQPMGTVNNCGNGFTPWGTYLTCEENFNGYFGWTDPDFVPNEKQARYGFRDGGFGYGWHEFDPRFDLANPEYANEYNRFGWIVEIDPQNPDKPPVKHTALGNFKHEGIAIRKCKDTGKIHCYMGDDQRFDYCYRFVSKYPWKKSVRMGVSPLAEGTLYVARFDENNRGEWLELSMNNPVLAERFSSLAEILVNTRIAADLVGATPMDRPEWTTIAADRKTVFWTLTNNSRRAETNAANTEAPNNDGHIIKTRDYKGDHTKFKWDFFILASQTRGTDGVFTDPDAAYADAEGRLFIGTDGGQPDGLQDQLTVFDTTKRLAPGELPTPHRLFVGVKSDEITGWAQTPDQTVAMVNMQHPGNGDPLATNFPVEPYDGVTIPRDCTIVITRKDGGIVGS